jgi:hypothetical protein
VRPAWVKSSSDPISTNKSWAWWYTSVISVMQEPYRRDKVQAGPGVNEKPYSKIKKTKRLGTWLK